MSLNSFNSSISSDFSFSIRLALIEIGLGPYEPDPRSTSSNSSFVTTCTFFSAMTFSPSSLLLSSPKLSCATQHAKLSCYHSWLRPTCISLIGPARLHNLYTILPLRPRTLTHWGVSSDSAAGAYFLSFFCASNSLRSSSWSPWTSSHLGTKVPRGFDTELSPDGAHWL